MMMMKTMKPLAAEVEESSAVEPSMEVEEEEEVEPSVEEEVMSLLHY
jgi:hypothetical protein